HIPSYMEHCQVEAHLAAAEADIERYDDEIAFLSRMLESLKQHREIREQDRFNYKAVLSPSRRAPMEIWTQIFVLSM
ncbi:hypothetical protein C8J56DRAFT_755104, partial [Mycena floridula]